MEASVSDILGFARERHATAVRLSGQASYHRRAPLPESLPHYTATEELARQVLQRTPQNREALMLMSQVHEGMMRFDLAALFLTKAFDAGEPRTKKLMKRMALLRQSDKEWRDLVLTPEELRSLGEFLEENGVGPSNRTRNLTQRWIVNNTGKDLNEVLRALDRRGAYSDFQVLANLVYG